MEQVGSPSWPHPSMDLALQGNILTGNHGYSHEDEDEIWDLNSKFSLKNQSMDHHGSCNF